MKRAPRPTQSRFSPRPATGTAPCLHPLARLGFIDSRARPYPILFYAHRPAVSGWPLPSSDQRPPARREKTHASSRAPCPQPVRLAASLARLFFVTGRTGVYVPRPIGDRPRARPRLIRAAAPFSPKRRGSLLVEAPSHRGLLLAAASGFTCNGYAFAPRDADVLDAWLPPARGVLATLHDDLPWLRRTSPPPSCAGLIEAIATARGVAPPKPGAPGPAVPPPGGFARLPFARTGGMAGRVFFRVSPKIRGEKAAGPHPGFRAKGLTLLPPLRYAVPCAARSPKKPAASGCSCPPSGCPWQSPAARPSSARP